MPRDLYLRRVADSSILDMLEGRATIQKDPEKVQGGAGRNLMRFNKSCTWEGETTCNNTGW